MRVYTDRNGNGWRARWVPRRYYYNVTPGALGDGTRWHTSVGYAFTKRGVIAKAARVAAELREMGLR